MTTPRPIHVRFTKWDGSLHWHFDTTRLGADEHGVWLGAPRGTPVRRGDGEAILSPAFALLIPEDTYWVATFNTPDLGGAFAYDVYVDVCTPPVWDGSTMTAVDLDLDVVRTFDGVVAVHDEDEFEDHAARFTYPQSIVEAARMAAASSLAAIEAGDEPFATVGREWLGRAVELGRGPGARDEEESGGR